MGKLQGRTVLILLVVVMSCFTVGILSVLLDQPQAIESTQTVTPSPRKTALILGVNQIRSMDSKLQSIWLATHRPPDQEVFLIGVPLDFEVCTSSVSTIEQTFGWTPEGGVDPRFLDVFDGELLLKPDAIIVADEIAFAELINFLGGIEFNNEHILGNVMVAFLDVVAEDPTISISTQQKVLVAMVAEIYKLDEPFDPSPLLPLMPDHAYSSVSIQELIATFYLPISPLEPGDIQVYPIESHRCPVLGG
jgi:hypothetical protein